MSLGSGQVLSQDQSYLDRSSLISRSVAELTVVTNTENKQNYLILSFAVETLGAWYSEVIEFINKLGKMITQQTERKTFH